MSVVVEIDGIAVPRVDVGANERNVRRRICNVEVIKGTPQQWRRVVALMLHHDAAHIRIRQAAECREIHFTKFDAEQCVAILEQPQLMRSGVPTVARVEFAQNSAGAINLIKVHGRAVGRGKNRVIASRLLLKIDNRALKSAIPNDLAVII